MVTVLLFTALFVVLLGAGAAYDRYARATGRKKVRAVGFPLPWVPLIERGVPEYRRMPLDLCELVQSITFCKINDLLFDGLGRYEQLPDSIIVSVGGHVGVLHARMRIPPLPTIRIVVVGEAAEIETRLREEPERWGESTLVTEWDEQAQAARMYREERDEVISGEVARLAPELGGRLFYAGWARFMPNDSPAARERAEAVLPGCCDDPRLFAAASEVFVRAPGALLRAEPQRYAALRAFYRLDPSRWGGRRGP